VRRRDRVTSPALQHVDRQAKGKTTPLHAKRFDLVASSATTAPAPAIAAAASAAPTVPTASSSAATVATAAAPTRAFFTRTGFVHGQRSTLELFRVQGGNSCIRSVTHFHEGKPSRPAGLAVHHDLGLRHRPELPEELAEVFLRRRPGQVPNIQVLAHD
jgi:hypothetical protein